MTQPPINQLTPLQQTILDVVRQYPDQFSRSGLAKMLVGAKSWQNKGFPEYGHFASHTRKAVTTDIDILVQQGYLALNDRSQLISRHLLSGGNQREALDNNNQNFV